MCAKCVVKCNNYKEKNKKEDKMYSVKEMINIELEKS